jgi:hypothetical protein
MESLNWAIQALNRIERRLRLTESRMRNHHRSKNRNEKGNEHLARASPGHTLEIPKA